MCIRHRSRSRTCRSSRDLDRGIGAILSPHRCSATRLPLFAVCLRKATRLSTERFSSSLGQIDNLRVLTRESKNVEARRRPADLSANDKTARRLRRDHLIGDAT